jgi:hypothetical protein
LARLSEHGGSIEERKLTVDPSIALGAGNRNLKGKIRRENGEKQEEKGKDKAEALRTRRFAEKIVEM